MPSFRSSIGCRAADVAARRRWRVVTTTLLPVLILSGCARRTKPDTSPRTVLTGPAPAKTTAIDSVRAAPIPVASSAPARGPITLHLSPVTADTVHGPPMWIVDGQTLGLRDDGTIDRDAARRALARIDPRTISSIQVLKGDVAVRRFGPGAAEGVALIELVTHASRARAGDP